MYGSLQFPEVLRVLLGRVPPLTPATARHWHVNALPDEVYPGLVPGGGPSTGFVLTDLTADEWLVLDAFEDALYLLTRLDICDGWEAWAYTCPPESAPPPATWDRAEFAEHHLQEYVVRCAAWLDRFRNSQSSRLR